MTAGETPATFFSLLVDRCGSEEQASRLLENTVAELGLGMASVSNRTLQAVTLVKTGYPLASVARSLTWKEFEQFCANIFRASGFHVTENVFLKKPRRQVDILVRSGSFALSVDCKHWKKSIGDAGLSSFARHQLQRSAALRRKLGTNGLPLISMILTVLDEPSRILDGVAVVPLFSLRDFLISVDGIRDLLAQV